MIRSPLGTKSYWDQWVEHRRSTAERMLQQCRTPAKNPNYRPQYLFELAKEQWELILTRYSRGDAVNDLAVHFGTMLDAWEESERLGKDVYTPEQQRTRRDWKENLDHYVVCFWLTGLALTLNIPDDQWKRLIVLIDNEGNDILLDRVIAGRERGRKIGTTLCHPKPYERLLKAIDAPVEQQAELLRAFVDHWYPELDRPGNQRQHAIYRRPYWYTFGDQNFEGGAYFGRWCVEAVVAVKVFGLDDSMCLGHEHYPGDLLRPNGPSTHPARTEKEGNWLSRIFRRV